MAFNVTNLLDYVKGNPEVVLQDVILEGKSFDLLRVEEGIKSSMKVLEHTDSTINFQTGDYSGYDGFDGDDTLKDVTVAVTEFHVKKKYVRSQIEKSIVQVAMKMGSDPEDIPAAVAEAIMYLNGRAMVYQNEQALWRGDSVLTTGNLQYFDGFVKQITDGAPVTTGTAPVALTKANAVASVERMVEKAEDSFPNFTGIETHLYMSPKNFQVYFRTLYGLNGAIDRDNINGEPITSLRIPGTNVIAQAIPGLDGTNEMILTRPDNLIIGTDLKSETDSFEFFFNPYARHYELFALWKLGAKVIRTDECVIEAL